VKTSDAIEQRSKEALKAGYSRGVRAFEITSIVVFAGLMFGLMWKLAPRAAEMPFLALTAMMLGYLGADFTSGFVHWAADTWGTPEWPVVGAALIRPFREHHVDQKEITRHDFIETNGNNCFISIGPAIGALCIAQFPGAALRFFFAAFLFFLVLWVFLTNQFHKWSHVETPSPMIDRLQRWHLILPRDHHQLHHTAPYSKHYCITVGWLNEPLYRIGFFPLLERIITATTGMVPREDDIGKKAALAITELQDFVAPKLSAPMSKPS